jgi:hypothetical protein
MLTARGDKETKPHKTHILFPPQSSVFTLVSCDIFCLFAKVFLHMQSSSKRYVTQKVMLLSNKNWWKVDGASGKKWEGGR